MVDIFSKKSRSKIMASIRGKGTHPEILIQKRLSKAGFRYRKNHFIREARARPDIVFVSSRVCVFIDGCFWHKCPVCYRAPTSNTAYWNEKITRNVKRDKKQRNFLKKLGWKVLSFWEHEAVNRSDAVFKKMRKALTKRGIPRRKSLK